MNEAIRVLCVDDHAFLVEGLRARFAIEHDMEFVGHLPNTTELGDQVARSKADVVLLDIEMPGPDAFEAIGDLRRRFPAVRTILLSAHVRDQYIDRAYRAGAWGYLSKGDSPDAVIDGIRRVTRGELAFSPEVLTRAAGSAGQRPSGGRKGGERSRLGLLTDREKTILRMIARGLSRTRIARELCRSPMTIDNHRKSIMRKLGIHDRGELVRYAINEGLD
jgi:DNA-binding NarL/FixJ family response regulator